HNDPPDRRGTEISITKQPFKESALTNAYAELARQLEHRRAVFGADGGYTSAMEHLEQSRHALARWRGNGPPQMAGRTQDGRGGKRGPAEPKMEGVYGCPLTSRRCWARRTRLPHCIATWARCFPASVPWKVSCPEAPGSSSTWSRCFRTPEGNSWTPAPRV